MYISLYIYTHYNIASLEYVTLHYVTLHYIHTIVPSNNHNEPNCTRQFANEQNLEGRKVMGTTIRARSLHTEAANHGNHGDEMQMATVELQP